MNSIFALFYIENNIQTKVAKPRKMLKSQNVFENKITSEVEKKNLEIFINNFLRKFSFSLNVLKCISLRVSSKLE